MITSERLRKLLSYDPLTGDFTWLENRAAVVKAGDRAGSFHASGHWLVRIDGRNYFAHRLAWFYMHRSWPINQIDHINRIRDDNRIENLRDVERFENMQNQPHQTHNKCGVKGVSWSKSSNKWAAQITHKGKTIYLGTFIDINDAAKAYSDGAAKYHTYNPSATGKDLK